MSEGGAATSADYRGYLDKEMTIMGVLSAFSVSAVIIVLKGLEDIKADSILRPVWDKGSGLVVAGCIFSLVAGMLFYLQRSTLAWYYGQIALAEIGLTRYSVREWLVDADSWAAWNRYRLAFCCLSISFFEYCCALLRVKPLFVPSRAWVSFLLVHAPFAVAAMIVVGGIAHTLVLNRLRYSDDPYRLVYRFVRRKLRGPRIR